MSEGWRFWIDRGGTFTDVVGRSPDGELTSLKLLSDNPTAYPDAALEGIRRLLGSGDGDRLPVELIDSIRMGTTVATNALLERKGDPTVLVTTKGFADAPRIAFQNRPEIFARAIELPSLLHSRVIEARERLDAYGNTLIELDEDHIRRELRAAFDEGFRNVAVSLLHAFGNGGHEARIGAIAREIGFAQVSLSHEVSPLMKLVPRTDTTVADAYLSAGLRRYVDRIAAATGGVRLSFMRSSGGLAAAENFRGKDAVLSGPAGGIVAMARTAQAAGFARVIGFDMGGTSTDVSRFAGEFDRRFDTEVAGVRMRAPMLRIHTVAAGGGSILRFDGARYRVGPDSAGADPGPACYRLGGPLTVTDANVMLGRLRADHFPAVFGPDQDLPLDVDVVRRRFGELAERIDDGRTPEQVAEGFIEIAVSNMADAIKRISVQEGHDVTRYTLATFGGAGGQHACAVADQLGVETVLIHPLAGVLSAYGMGMADVTATAEHAVERPLTEETVRSVRREADRLIASCEAELAGEDGPLTHTVRVLVKYAGTDSTVPIPLADPSELRAEFARRYRERFSFLMPNRELVVEAVTVEVAAVSRELVETPREGEPADVEPTVVDAHFAAPRRVPLYDRADLTVSTVVDGPAIITDPQATTVVEPGWRAEVTPLDHLLLRRVEPRPRPEADTEADPVLLELFNNMFMSIAEQMGHRLRATANSVNIKERLDFSCAIFDAHGNLIANAPHIPVHLGSMSESIKAVVAAHRDTMRPGDSYVLNNPYSGGTHLPDITVITPVFDLEVADRPLFHVASRGHHADVGGIAPGSMPAFSRSVADEGVLLDGVLLARDGLLREDDVLDLLTGAAHPARSPADNLADLRAQLAANETGVVGLRRLRAAYGLDVVNAYMGHVRDNAEHAVRAVIDSLDDGHFVYETDSGSVIEVTIGIDRVARTAHIDFTGTSPQRDDNFNAPSSVVTAAVLYVFRTLVADEIPLNAGCLAPITITIPPRSMLSPEYPAAVVAGNVETSQAVVAALYGALGAQAEGAGTMNNVTFGNDRHQYYETVSSGSGAGPGFDGTDVVQTHMTNSRLTDPEVLERRFPVRLEEFAIRVGSGGAGTWRGGDGAVRRLRFDEPMTLTLLSGNRVRAPYGLAGGRPGEVGRQWIERGDGTVSTMNGCDTVSVEAGDVFVMHTPGGGGYGEPAEHTATPVDDSPMRHDGR